jgi:hypothetical protein
MTEGNVELPFSVESHHPVEAGTIEKEELKRAPMTIESRSHLIIERLPVVVQLPARLAQVRSDSLFIYNPRLDIPEKPYDVNVGIRDESASRSQVEEHDP